MNELTLFKSNHQIINRVRVNFNFQTTSVLFHLNCIVSWEKNKSVVWHMTGAYDNVQYFVGELKAQFRKNLLTLIKQDMKVTQIHGGVYTGNTIIPLRLKLCFCIFTC